MVNWENVIDTQNCGNARMVKKDCPWFGSSDKRDFNCGGYALGIEDWYVPSSFYNRGELDFYDDCWEYMTDNEYYSFCDKLADVYIEDMIDEGLVSREVYSPDADVEAGSRIIAFRASPEDFHFIRKMSDGTWTHKAGGTKIQEFDEDALDDQYWDNVCDMGYGGQTRYLVVKN